MEHHGFEEFRRGGEIVRAFILFYSDFDRICGIQMLRLGSCSR